MYTRHGLCYKPHLMTNDKGSHCYSHLTFTVICVSIIFDKVFNLRYRLKRNQWSSESLAFNSFSMLLSSCVVYLCMLLHFS